jgi:hypothetical protein
MAQLQSTSITGSLIVTQGITAQSLNVQYITSSIVYSSGSNKFGDQTSDTQSVTGSLNISGSMFVDGTTIFDTSTGNTPVYITRLGNTNEALRIYVDDSAAYFQTFQDETATSYGSMYFILDNGAPTPEFGFQYGATTVFKVQNASNSYINHGGNFGIGTTSPTTRLEVNRNTANTLGTADGVLQISGDLSPIAFVGQSNLNPGLNRWGIKLREVSDGDFSIYSYTNSATRLLINSSGNVGIGVTNPARLLDINGTTNFRDAFYFSNGAVGYTTWGTIDGALALNIQAASGYGINLGTNASTGRVVVTSGGNVGIGTVSPTAKLYVSGSSDVLIAKGSGSTSNTTILAVDGNNGRLFEVSDDLSDSLFSVNTIAGLPVMEAFADYTVVMGSYNKSDLVITGSKVGIGTPNPQRKLDVYDSGSQIIAQFSSSNATSTRIKFSDANTGAENVNVGAIGTRFAVWTNNTERLSILSGGSVGIGSSSPGHALSVLGTISASAFLGSVTTATSASFATSASYANNAGNAATANFATSAGSATTATSASFATSASNARSAITASSADTFFVRGSIGVGISNPGSNLTVGTSFATIPGITVDTGNTGNSAFVARKTTSKPAFGLLPWDTAVFLSSGVYYDGDAWQHHSNDNNNQLFALDPAAGARWYASNSGTPSWNISNNQQLWDNNAHWTNIVRSTRAGDSHFTGGNVGINTTSPSNKLQVVGGVTATSFTGSLLGNASSATSANSATNADNIDITQINDNVNYQVTFTTANASSYSTLFIDTDDAHLTYNPSSRTLTSATFVGSLTGNADTVTNGVYTTGNQTIGGTKTFSSTIVGSINGNAATATTASYASTAPYSGLTGTVPTWNQNTTGNAATATSASFAPNFANTNLTLNDSRTHDLDGNILTFTATNDESIIFNHSSGGTFEINGRPTIQTTGQLLHSIGNATGNIGIGTQTTTARLHVSGTLGTLFRVQNGSTSALMVSSSGNVGIGTTNPIRDLQIGSLASTSTATPKTFSLGGTYSNSAGNNVKLRVYEETGGAIGGMSVSPGQMEVNTWSTGKIAFYRGTTQTMIIDGTGNVGIGTNTPAYKLEVRSGASNSYFTSFTPSAGSGFIRIYQDSNNQPSIYGANASGTVNIVLNTSGISYIQGGNVIIGGSADNGAAFQVVGNISASGNFYFGDSHFLGNETTYDNLLLQSSTGENINISSADNIYLKTGGTGPGATGTTRMFISSSGVTGMGTTNPVATLHIQSGATKLFLSNTDFVNGSVGSGMILHTGAQSGNTYSQIYAFQAGNTSYANLVVPGGNVGINTIVPTAKLHVVGDIKASLANTNQANFVGYNSSTGLLTYASTGSITVGTATNADNVYINDDSTDGSQPVLFASTVNEYLPVRGEANFHYNPSTRTLTVDTLQASEKSFVIPHQGLPGKKLVYGVLEGPEHSVYVRGKSSERVIELPQEWEWLVDEDSITVSLTPIGEPNAIYVEEIADNKIYVNSNADTLKYFYHVYATRKDVEPLKTVQ